MRGAEAAALASAMVPAAMPFSLGVASRRMMQRRDSCAMGGVL
jgi:hypothetical protein